MFDRVTLEFVEDTYLDKDRVVFVPIPFIELCEFERGVHHIRYCIAYQELEDLKRYEAMSDFIIAVDIRSLGEEYKRRVEIVNSPAEIKYPWQKCTDDCEQWYLTLKNDDFAVIGVLVDIPPIGISCSHTINIVC